MVRCKVWSTALCGSGAVKLLMGAYSAAHLTRHVLQQTNPQELTMCDHNAEQSGDGAAQSHKDGRRTLCFSQTLSQTPVTSLA